MAKDPVCGMEVDPANARRSFVHAGTTYYFCAPSCRGLFAADPARYLAADYRPTMGGNRRRPRAVRLTARGEVVRIIQVVGTLFVCSRANGSCCCGWVEKGRLPFENALWADEWERRRLRSRLHLTFVGCLGPCASGNNALLQIHGQSVWLKDLNDPALVPAVYDYIEHLLAADRLVPPGALLVEHVFERYTGADDGGRPAEAADLTGLDPVCMMEVDPATADHALEHAGRRIGFCSQACLESFQRDPDAYLAL